jgi:hypothetical protein
MAGQQHGHPLPGQAADEQAHVAHAGRIQAGGRLVEEQQLRVAQQRGGDAQPLAHPVRVATHLVALAAGQLHHLQRIVDPLRSVAAVVGSQHLEVLARGDVRIERGRLDEPGHSLERAHARHRVAPEEAHRPLAGADEPQHHAQRRRLAGPVGPQIAIDVAGADGEVHTGDGGQFAIALDEPPNLDRWRSGTGVCRCRTVDRGVWRSRHGDDVSARAADSAAKGVTEPSTV